MMFNHFKAFLPPRGRSIAGVLLAIAAATILAGCMGKDYTPVYFPPPGGDDGQPAEPSVSTSARQCTVQFTSQLCVAIKGSKLSVGTGDAEPLCAEVPAFPLHIAGNTITFKGGEFPDIAAEGHGLPAPITINARGDGDGSGNVREGTIDASGAITIPDVSLYIVALGIVGEVPKLTLTTGQTGDLPDLPGIAGSPPDASGAMTLVTGTVLGHVIDAADQYLMGASLTASFKGSIAPALAQCGTEAARSIEVNRLSIAADGKQTEAPIPDGSRLEISSGTFIADGSLDVGPRYEASALFTVKNVSSAPQAIAIPAQKGAFSLASTSPLSGTLTPQQSLRLAVTFHPTSQNVQPGPVTENLSIGPDQFQLVATALAKSASGTVSVVDDGGAVTAPNVNEVDVGAASLPASTERRFFRCTEITCNDRKAFTGCSACPDPTTTPCELLAVSTDGAPLAEVDAQCKPVRPDAAPLYTIDLKGGGDIVLSAHKQVLALRNMGVEKMTITHVNIEDVAGSKSTGQFALAQDGIFIADRFADVQAQVAAALKDQHPQGAKLPAALPPYQPGYRETTAYIVITYLPMTLTGADGQQAGVGSNATDKAVLRISTDSGDITAAISGTKTIREAPALELYFKTATGTKRVSERTAFQFPGVTGQTVDVAQPFFMRVADGAATTLRITSIAIGGTDAAAFRWLDTKEKIAAVKPDAGKGMRCSIPTVDEATGQMQGESFDLNPVAIGAGYDLAPGASSIETMPLFGCVDFHRDAGDTSPKRLYEGTLTVEAVELTAAGLPAQNPDGSPRKTSLSLRLLAALTPLQGKYVLRISQTMAAILNPQFPTLAAALAKRDIAQDLASGTIKPSVLQVFTGALILDPFDEMTITTSDGKEEQSTPNDGTTAVFRRLDTHPLSQPASDELLYDYASLLYDGTAPAGARGIFEDYPNVPEGLRANGWRIFTTSLSYPGPLAPLEKRPMTPSDCLVINPCSAEAMKAFTDAGAPGGKGACAFFYASGARYDSPAFHTADEMEGGEYENLCNKVDTPQHLFDMDTGHATVDGRIVFEEVGFRFFGPTFFHNPYGPLGAKPAIDSVFHLAFTTGMLKPQEGSEDFDVLPDKRIDLAKNEYKVNLTNKAGTNPPLCEKNTQNRVIDGKPASTWKFLDGFLFKDEEGKVPAGCPEAGNGYNGGEAYLRGQDIDPATGVVTLVAISKFGASDDLTFAFKDVIVLFALRGWLCDPEGTDENLEGKHCFDVMFNDRDAQSQKSIVE
jgi:hypothetical protein